ncbi:MAG: 3D domain-containing protein [Planctomycetota bacterium]
MDKTKAKIRGFFSIVKLSSVVNLILIAGIVFVLFGASAKGGLTVADTSAGESGQWETVKMRVTAYCPCPKCCGSYSDGITACNHRIRQGDVFVAADSEYPFGTEMVIAGYNNGRAVKVLDRGGAIKGNRLDVFFNSHEEALEWGVRHIDVKVRRL